MPLVVSDCSKIILALAISAEASVLSVLILTTYSSSLVVSQLVDKAELLAMPQVVEVVAIRLSVTMVLSVLL